MTSTFYVCHLRTGRALGTLPLVGFTGTRHLLGQGTMQAKLHLGNLLTSDGETDWARINLALALSEPGPVSIVLDRDGQVAGEWVLWKRVRPHGFGPIDLSGGEIATWLNREPMPGLDSPEPGMDQATIARVIARHGFWAGGAASTPGAIAIDIPDDVLTGVRRVRRYPANDGNVGQRLSELAAVIGGFDWTVESSWTSIDGVRHVRRTFRVHYPQAGIDSSHRLLAGRNLTGMSALEDATGLASTAIVLCAGEGDTKIVGRATDPALIQRGWPASTVMRSALSVNQQSTADAKAAELLRRAQTTERPPTLEMAAHGEPGIGDLGLGDRVWVDGERSVNYPSGWRGRARIIGWTFRPIPSGVETVQLEVEPGSLDGSGGE